MEYTFIAPPPKANSGWMGHQLKLYVSRERKEEFKETLTRLCGGEEHWRIPAQDSKNIYMIGTGSTTVRFAQKKHAVAVKLQWEPEVDPMDDWYANFSKSFKSFNFAGARGVGKSIMNSQVMGRGIRNAHVTVTKPAANPLPWYDQFDYIGHLYSNRMISQKTMLGQMGLSGHNIDSILLDTEASVDPAWFSRMGLEAAGHDIVDIKVVKSRVSSAPPLKLSYDFRSGELGDPDAERTSG